MCSATSAAFAVRRLGYAVQELWVKGLGNPKPLKAQGEVSDRVQGGVWELLVPLF